MAKKPGTALPDVPQFAEFAGAVVTALPRDIDSSVAQGWIEPGNRSVLRKVLREALTPSDKPTKAVTATINGITPPIGGRIHVIFDVPVDESRSWGAAINALDYPYIPGDYDIWRVGSLYPSKQVQGVGPVFLVNFGPGSVTSSAQALAWGKSQKLHPASPRRTFAIGERHPKLDETLGMTVSMAVISLEECSFEGLQFVCVVWWTVTIREAHLSCFSYDRGDDYWFAFVRE